MRVSPVSVNGKCYWAQLSFGAQSRVQKLPAQMSSRAPEAQVNGSAEGAGRREKTTRCLTETTESIQEQ